jgi:hypothetical protein
MQPNFWVVSRNSPMAQFLQSQERSGFDHQRKAWYADPV